MDQDLVHPGHSVERQAVCHESDRCRPESFTKLPGYLNQGSYLSSGEFQVGRARINQMWVINQTGLGDTFSEGGQVICSNIARKGDVNDLSIRINGVTNRHDVPLPVEISVAG